jgi:hypothetical protein
MRTSSTLAAAAALSWLTASGVVEAAPIGPQNSNAAAQAGHVGSAYRAGLSGAPYYTTIGYAYPHCRAWARECAIRWGWQTWRWRRCMRIHAC